MWRETGLVLCVVLVLGRPVVVEPSKEEVPPQLCVKKSLVRVA